MAVGSICLAKLTLTQCRADVGGSSVPNDTPHCLARIPLCWMIHETFKTNTGIIMMFDTSGLKRIGFDPVALYKTRDLNVYSKQFRKLVDHSITITIHTYFCKSEEQ
jgi:hypothetical protein